MSQPPAPDDAAIDERPFLTAEWRDLVMASYAVDPAILGFLIETVAGGNPSATLPFVHGRQANGALVERQVIIDACSSFADGAAPEARVH